MGAIVVTRSVDLASPPERAWPFLADTERFNRLIGSHDVHYRPIEEGSTSSARFVAETRAGGVKLVYEEFPFEWSHQRTFGVHRRMRGGPVESYTWRVSLARTLASDGPGALEGGTRATVRMEIVPRWSLLAPIAWLNARQFTSKFLRLGPVIDAHVLEGTPSPYTKPASPADDERIAAAVVRLKADRVAPARVHRRVRQRIEKSRLIVDLIGVDQPVRQRLRGGHVHVGDRVVVAARTGAERQRQRHRRCLHRPAHRLRTHALCLLLGPWSCARMGEGFMQHPAAVRHSHVTCVCLHALNQRCR